MDDSKIKLECGHEFNYLPLYNEVINQKRNLNSLETTILKINQIKCPYCRHVCNNLLPYYEADNIYKVYGVNRPDNYIMPIFHCEWKFKTGKKKNKSCNNIAGKYKEGCYCSKHIDNIKNCNKNQCKKILKNRNQCKKTAKQNEDFCYIHNK